MLLTLILTMEIAFWALIGLGLVLRYPLNRPRAGLVLFTLTPLVDVVLLVLITLDLRGGAEPNWQHTLAAFYIGFSVMFGHRMIAWADRQYRVRFRGETAPAPTSGSPLRDEWLGFLCAVGALAISLGALELVIALAASPAAASLRGAWSTAGIILAVWLLTGPVWVLLGGGASRASEPTPPARRPARRLPAARPSTPWA